MVIYSYPFFVVITQLLSCIILLMIVYVYELVHLDNIYSWSYVLYKKMGVMRILHILST